MKKNRPKFKLGDIVVIVLYGTVGTITKIHFVDDQYVYEVNYSEVLYFENSLQLFSDYDGVVIETEKISIDVHYQIGDIVLVKGYGKSFFKVVGIRTEIWRYEEDGWEDLTYELTRISDGEWLEADEDEISLIISEHEAESFIQQLYLNNTLSDESRYDEFFSHYLNEENQEKPYIKITDELLDMYNDYHTLYQMFCDQDYKDMMQLIIRSLKRYQDPNL
ncbi:hypothetical protein FS935_02995 [Metabacillus litoralis]|uniref:YodN n=1 Tax=Metabacillus litoralis TaxID=152268 RepID=A0A5C6W5D9_9BACI|nr:hypothetical protein [Metabacillus litoralis]TXC93176.1 hypothetical protein FS935_02995 [Metabacillus litoralis]